MVNYYINVNEQNRDLYLQQSGRLTTEAFYRRLTEKRTEKTMYEKLTHMNEEGQLEVLCDMGTD